MILCRFVLSNGIICSCIFRVVSLLHVFVTNRLAEIIERETEAYYKMDPDPFDDRHPGKLNKIQN